MVGIISWTKIPDPDKISWFYANNNTVPAGFSDDQYINSTLALAAYIGFRNLNRVDENWSLNPVGPAKQ